MGREERALGFGRRGEGDRCRRGQGEKVQKREGEKVQKGRGGGEAEGMTLKSPPGAETAPARPSGAIKKSSRPL